MNLVGDPLNVVLIGSRTELVQALRAIALAPADTDTSDAIAELIALGRQDLAAPISKLTLYDRKQDLAFRREVATSADKRCHVRFWEAKGYSTSEWDSERRTLWIGDDSLDTLAGLKPRTGELTHQIDADVDAQRDLLFTDLEQHGLLSQRTSLPGVGATRDGRNAGEDRYFTNGKLALGVLDSKALPVLPPQGRADPFAGETRGAAGLKNLK